MRLQGDGMKRVQDSELRALLDSAIAGRIDELAPEQIERLAAYLDESPEAAALLAGVAPPTDARVSAAILPTDRDWDRVWTKVESAGTGRVQRVRQGRIIRFSQGFAAVAACIGIVFMMQRAAVVQRPELPQFAVGAEIRELDVAAGYTARVDLDQDGGSSIIWIYEDEEEGV